MHKASSADKPAHVSLVDFADVNACVLQSYPDILAQWLPGGVQQGLEYSVCNPLRNDRSRGNFKINKNGKWADFATSDKGTDPISLYAWLNSLTQVESKNMLAEMFGMVQGRSGIDPAIQQFLDRMAARRQAPGQFGEPGQGWVQGPAPDDAPTPVVPGNHAFWRYQSLSGAHHGAVSLVQDRRGQGPGCAVSQAAGLQPPSQTGG